MISVIFHAEETIQKKNQNEDEVRAAPNNEIAAICHLIFSGRRKNFIVLALSSAVALQMNYDESIR